MLLQNYIVKWEMKKKYSSKPREKRKKKKNSSKPSEKWKRNTLASYGNYTLCFWPFTTFDRK
jgi:hypothetical protein